MILSDEMLTAAFRYRDSMLWERLNDSMIFAFRLRDGETGYCSVMGNAGEHLALAFYRGTKGFNTYLKTLDAERLPQLELLENVLTFDSINCDFMNSSDAKELDKDAKNRIREFAKANGLKIRRPKGWPDFTRHCGYQLPRGIIAEGDAQDITEALNAAIAVAEKLASLENDQMYALGFDRRQEYPTKDGGKKIPFLIPEADGSYTWSTTTTPAFSEDEYPMPIYENMIMASRLKEIPHEGTFQCRAIHISEPVEEPGIIPYFPSILLFAAKEKQFIFPVMVKEPIEEDPAAMLNELGTTLLEQGVCPANLEVKDKKTKNLLADFCKKTGITIRKVKYTSRLDNACDMLMMMGMW